MYHIFVRKRVKDELGYHYEVVSSDHQLEDIGQVFEYLACFKDDYWIEIFVY